MLFGVVLQYGCDSFAPKFVECAVKRNWPVVGGIRSIAFFMKENGCAMFPRGWGVASVPAKSEECKYQVVV